MKLGCLWRSQLVRAVGDGSKDDTLAIQNCLYAAGAEFRDRCPARAWSESLGYPDCVPTKLIFPTGKYFVQGTWETMVPKHSDNEDSGYAPQWVVFNLPRGIALHGEGIENTILTLNRKDDCVLDKNQDGVAIEGSNTCRDERFEKRRGTYLFMGGFEKSAGYCDQPSAQLQNELCRFPEGSDERLAGGAQNSFEDMTLEGDLPALVNHWIAGKLKSQSTAIHMNSSRDLLVRRVKINSWYRAVNSRQGNGNRVLNSKIYNMMKASLYFILPTAQPQFNHNIGARPSSRLPTFLGTNEVANSPLFFEVMRAKGIKPWGALNGLYAIGNNNSVGCSDVSFVNNTLRYAKIYYEQPCAKVQIARNRISKSAMPIQVGSFENLVGLNLATEILIADNEITESLSGVLIRGCDFNDKEPRCINPSARPVIRGNRMRDFLPLEGTGSDPWVTLTARPGKSLAGVTTSDASYVAIDSNEITDLRNGSQTFGIGVQGSRWNTQHAFPQQDCYSPIQASRNISIRDNKISFSLLPNENTVLGLRGKQNVGVYLENATGVFYRGGVQERVQTNRLIRSELTPDSESGAFCDLAESFCPRRMDSGRLLMSTSCLNNLLRCEFRIPGIVSEKENTKVFRDRYEERCNASVKDTSDEEFRLPD